MMFEPKIGIRFLVGQDRCTFIPAFGRVKTDLSAVMNAGRGRYVPHQSTREMERRRARGW
jgi:hypothetical protein